MSETLAYPAPTPSRPHFVGLPNATITLGQHDDGRWMWATDYSTTNHGAGYACLPKWGNFAATRDEALQCAVDELRKRWRNKADCAALQRWLDTLQPQQADLYGRTA